jgi:hypothetical protein
MIMDPSLGEGTARQPDSDQRTQVIANVLW